MAQLHSKFASLYNPLILGAPQTFFFPPTPFSSFAAPSELKSAKKKYAIKNVSFSTSIGSSINNKDYIREQEPIKENSEKSNISGIQKKISLTGLDSKEDSKILTPQEKWYTSYSKFSEMNMIKIKFINANFVRSSCQRILPNGKIIGRIENANTLHHKTLKPLKGGLFCEGIFGPVKDFVCACGKTKRSLISRRGVKTSESNKSSLLDDIVDRSNIQKRIYCPDCDVEYTWSVIRRYQLGYIGLASPVIHIWYLKGNPSYISTLLDMKRRHLEYVNYGSESLTIEYSIKKGIGTNIALTANEIISSWKKSQEFIKFQNNFSQKTPGSSLIVPQTGYEFYSSKLDRSKDLIQLEPENKDSLIEENLLKKPLNSKTVNSYLLNYKLKKSVNITEKNKQITAISIASAAKNKKQLKALSQPHKGQGGGQDQKLNSTQPQMKKSAALFRSGTEQKATINFVKENNWLDFLTKVEFYFFAKPFLIRPQFQINLAYNYLEKKTFKFKLRSLFSVSILRKFIKIKNHSLAKLRSNQNKKKTFPQKHFLTSLDKFNQDVNGAHEISSYETADLKSKEDKSSDFLKEKMIIDQIYFKKAELLNFKKSFLKNLPIPLYLLFHFQLRDIKKEKKEASLNFNLKKAQLFKMNRFRCKILKNIYKAILTETIDRKTFILKKFIKQVDKKVNASSKGDFWGIKNQNQVFGNLLFAGLNELTQMKANSIFDFYKNLEFSSNQIFYVSPATKPANFFNSLITPKLFKEKNNQTNSDPSQNITITTKLKLKKFLLERKPIFQGLNSPHNCLILKKMFNYFFSPILFDFLDKKSHLKLRAAFLTKKFLKENQVDIAKRCRKWSNKLINPFLNIKIKNFAFLKKTNCSNSYCNEVNIFPQEVSKMIIQFDKNQAKRTSDHSQEINKFGIALNTFPFPLNEHSYLSKFKDKIYILKKFKTIAKPFTEQFNFLKKMLFLIFKVKNKVLKKSLPSKNQTLILKNLSFSSPRLFLQVGQLVEQNVLFELFIFKNEKFPFSSKKCIFYTPKRKTISFLPPVYTPSNLLFFNSKTKTKTWSLAQPLYLTPTFGKGAGAWSVTSLQKGLTANRGTIQIKKVLKKTEKNKQLMAFESLLKKFACHQKEKVISNNFYNLSYRERWKFEKHWVILSLYNIPSFANFEDIINPMYKKRLWQADNDLYSQPVSKLRFVPLWNWKDYKIFSKTKELNLKQNKNSFFLNQKTNNQFLKSNFNLKITKAVFSGPGVINELLNEFNLDELKKMDLQNTFMLYIINKEIMMLKSTYIKRKLEIKKLSRCAKMHLRKVYLDNIPFNPTIKEKEVDRGGGMVSGSVKNESPAFGKLNFPSEMLNKKFAEVYKKRELLIRRTKLIRQLERNLSDPRFMMIRLLPVLPPDLRPILKMGNQIAASDLNRLYQRVIYRNDRLKKFLLDIGTNNSYEIKYIQRLVQQAVDNLISNGKSGGTSEKDSRGRLLKSLSDNLKGKEGRFRQYLLGKRIDYSGRSVIVVSPSLKLHECGIPKEMAFELYFPFLLKAILNQNLTKTVIGAKTLIKKNSPLVWELLIDIMKSSPVLLNRAPTLHRLGIQAFQPKLIEGRAILLHPLVCSAFNADFDGDQMAVHIPITIEARAEAWKLMLSRNNLLSTATGEPLAIPSQDMVLGCYYLTTNCSQKNIKYKKGSGSYFSSFFDVIRSYENKNLDLHSIIWVKWPGSNLIENGNDQEEPLEIRINSYGDFIEIYSKSQKYYDKNRNLITQYISTTPGKVLFNRMIEQKQFLTKLKAT